MGTEVMMEERRNSFDTVAGALSELLDGPDESSIERLTSSGGFRGACD